MKCKIILIMKISIKRNDTSNSNSMQLDPLNNFIRSGLKLTSSMVSEVKARKALLLPIPNAETSATLKT